jgi:hypothetical protein
VGSQNRISYPTGRIRQQSAKSIAHDLALPNKSAGCPRPGDYIGTSSLPHGEVPDTAEHDQQFDGSDEEIHRV